MTAPTHLTDADREAIHAPHSVPVNPAWWSGCPICGDYLIAVEAIVQRAVTAALNDAADAIEAAVDNPHSSRAAETRHYARIVRART